MSAELGSAALLAVASLAVLLLFVRGSRRRVRETRVRTVVLAAGLGALVAAQSPALDELADRSFAWHMVQHLMLVVAAAPLLVLAHPVAAVVAGLGPRARRPLMSLHRAARTGGLARVDPRVGFLSHVSTVVLWHAPMPFDAALRHAPLHALEHVSFFGTALLFWTPVLTARGRRRLTELGALACLIGAAFVGSAIGAILTLSSTPLYQTYVAEEGRTAALHDQQLAGLLMWIPGSAVYLLAAAFVFARWVDGVERAHPRVGTAPRRQQDARPTPAGGD